MIGAIAGDIIGSTRSISNSRDRDYHEPLYLKFSTFTHATVLGIAGSDAILTMHEDYKKALRDYFRRYNRNTDNGIETIDLSYGKNFMKWAWSESDVETEEIVLREADLEPLFLSVPIGWCNASLQITLGKTDKMVKMTHENTDIVIAAKAIALVIYLSRFKKSKEEIRHELETRFRIDMDYPVEYLVQNATEEDDGLMIASYALSIFFESTDFEDAMRKVLQIPYHTEAIGFLAGGLCEAFYGVPTDIEVIARERVRTIQIDLYKSLKRFENEFGYKICEPKYNGVSRLFKKIKLSSDSIE